MKALRYHARGDLRLDEVPEPEPAAGQIKVAVAAAGICGSDLHEYRAGPLSVPATAKHPLTGARAPVTLGHEFSGEVVAVGPDAPEALLGSRVAVNALLRCGTCRACTEGNPQLCIRLGFHGLSGGGGGFAPFDTFPAELAHALPDSVTDQVGALLEPLATGVHAVARAGIGPGSDVLVAGGGPIGLMVVVAARAAGAGQVVVSEPAPARRLAAHRVGATTVLDPRSDDVAAAARDLTGGHGVDAAFDAAAAATSLDTVVGAVRSRGTVVNVAGWEHTPAFSPNVLLLTELVLTGALAYTRADFDRAVEIAHTGDVDLSSLISREIALEDAIAEGFERLARAPGDDIKVLVRPQGLR